MNNVKRDEFRGMRAGCIGSDRRCWGITSGAIWSMALMLGFPAFGWGQAHQDSVAPAPSAIPGVATWGKVVGIVFAPETGGRVPDAVVSIVGTDLRRGTNHAGWFEFWDVPAGPQVLRVERLGRASIEDSIFVRADRIVEVHVSLPFDPIPLPGMTVTTHPTWLITSGFFHRRRWAHAFRGRQWTSQELEQRDPVYLQEVVGEVPGVMRIGTSMLGPRGCRLGIHIDGFRMDRNFDLDVIDPGRVEALEVYHGSPAPLGYAGCGTILVWLKHRLPTNRATAG